MLAAVHGAALAGRIEREQDVTGCAWVLEGHVSILVARGFLGSVHVADVVTHQLLERIGANAFGVDADVDLQAVQAHPRAVDVESGLKAHEPEKKGGCRNLYR